MFTTYKFRRMLVSLLLLFVFFSVANAFANDKDTVQYPQYLSVSVSSGDSVWSIAARYNNNKNDIRDTMYAIRKINGLNNNAQIYPGQVLKIPIQN